MVHRHLIGRAASLALALLVAAGCAAVPPEQASLPGPVAPTATPAPTATSEPVATATLAPAPTPAPTRAPRSPYAGTLDLVRAEQPLTPDPACPQPSPLSLPSRGVIPLAFVPSGFCLNGEIGLVEIEERLYVAQAILGEAAFTLIDAT